MADIPHQAVIYVQVRGEVCERLPSGQVGKPKSKTKRSSRLYTVVGSSYEECAEKADKLIQTINEALDGKAEA